MPAHAQEPDTLMVLSFAVCEPAAITEAGALLRERLLAAHPASAGSVECHVFDGPAAERILASIHTPAKRQLAELLAANPGHVLVMGMLAVPSLPMGRA